MRVRINQKATATSKALFATLLGCALLYSCISPHGVNMSDVDQAEWHAGSNVSVSYSNSDTVSLRSIALILRLSSKYDYDRLKLSVCTIAPDGRRWTDSVSIPISIDPTLNTNYIDLDIPFRNEVKLNQNGNYLFIFKHLMPSATISGVAAAGVDIK